MTNYLAGVQDTHSTDTLSALVGKTLAGVLVVSVAAFVVLLLVRAYGKVPGDGRFQTGGGRVGRGSGIKNILPVIGCWVLFVVLVTGVWGLVSMSGSLSSGLFD
ncbi:hypothetical protein P5W04_10300 [Mycobacteroides abscessus subsp. abscessus]|uniref:hypothetical protein n=1 Tax=Mycobacteroides abscessus TaxID=36809 RepID=UPI000E6A8498|nr:hypothetical protein [Mycobacteroides abscessus]MBN7484554.1 hypothetical protein [Mycobacteroides abscessus subsp. abscessus]MDO3240505.1 hypothetical protein [Mycobacteroides abscessus subsp. abscessus]RIT74999.1 hypothetical protein D2E77_01570 [Mycobacteroides abscessus]